MRLQKALANFPEGIKLPFAGNPIVPVKLKSFRKVSMEKGEYTFSATYGKRTRTFKFYFPEINDDGTYLHKGNLYVGVPSLEYPSVVIHDTPRTRKVTISGVETADLVFTLFEGDVTVKKSRSLGTDLDNPHILATFISKDDRKSFNELIGREDDCEDPWLNSEDIPLIKGMLEEEVFISDPKHISNMRALTIEDKVVRMLVTLLQKALINFTRGKEINADYVNGQIESFLSTSPQCQLYMGSNPMALQGLKEKIKVPMEPWAPLDVARPHDTWKDHICAVDTPQSARAGEILAMADGARIENSRLVEGNSKLSGLLKRTVLFPHLLHPNRVVMVSSIVEQTCDLGPNNSKLKIQVPGCENYPQPFGTYANVAYMDWNATHEDGCVISESFAKRLTTKGTHTDRVIIPAGEEAPTVHLEIGQQVKPFMPVFTSEEGRVFRSDIKTVGVVQEFFNYMDIVGGAECQVFEVVSEITYRCEVGSKLSGLHSNKATVSRILPDWLMPHPSSNVPMDMIYSPASIAKRKMPSLVMEGMINRWMEINAIDSYTTTGEENFEDVAELLGGDGLEQLYQMGVPFKHQTLVLPVFMMLLHHHPVTKLRIGTRVKHDHLGKQQRGIGNNRYGREELEVLFQHGAFNTISEIHNLSGSSTLHLQMKEYRKVLS